MYSKKYLARACLISCGMQAVMAASASAASTKDIDMLYTNPYESGTGFISYNAGRTVAQTFTPGFSMVLDGIELETDSWASYTYVPMTLTIHHLSSADSPVGDVLGAKTFTPSSSYITHGDLFDLSSLGIRLDQGEYYSVVISSDFSGNPDYGNAVKFHAGWRYPIGELHPNAYPQGMMWTNDTGTWVPTDTWISNYIAGISDIAMNTYGTPIPAIPEPSAAVLVLSALGIVLSARGRQSKSLRG